MSRQNSPIEWTDATWNPVTGCSKVSPGCAHCYAEGVADRFWETQYKPVQYVTCSNAAGCDHSSGDCKPFEESRPRVFTDVWCHEDRLDQPLRWQKPRRIFVNSMSDLFHEDVEDAFIGRVFETMACARQHTFQILTKRAERMRDFMLKYSADGGPLGPIDHNFPHVWLGVSVENQRFADERIPLLLQTPAAVRFISAEPLLGPVNLEQVVNPGGIAEGQRYLHTLKGYAWEVQGADYYDVCSIGANLNWVIVGGESGHDARPFHVAWARSIVQQCQAAAIPVFCKQLGANVRDRNDAGFEGDFDGSGTAWPEHLAIEDRIEDSPNGYRQEWQGDPVRLHLRNRKGGDPAEWPEDLRVRQFPEVRA